MIHEKNYIDAYVIQFSFTIILVLNNNLLKTMFEGKTMFYFGLILVLAIFFQLAFSVQIKYFLILF